MPLLIDQLFEAARRRELVVEGDTELARLIAGLRMDHPEPDVDEDAWSPWWRLARTFGLDATDAALLWAIAAPDLDPRVAPILGAICGDPAQGLTPLALALELVGVSPGEPEAFARLAETGSLRRHGLVEPLGGDSWLQRRLRCPEPVLAALAGGLPGDPVVEGIRVTLVGLPVPGVDTVTAALDHGASLVWVRSRHGMSGSALAAGAFEAIGAGYLAIDLHRYRGGDLDLLVRRVVRDAGLRGRGLVLLGCERAAEPEVAPFLHLLESAAVPVVAVGSVPWNGRWGAHHPVVVEAGPLSVEDRVSVWSSELGVEVTGDLLETVCGFRLGTEEVVEAARLARLTAAVEGRGLDDEMVRTAVRRIGGSAIATSGLGMTTRAGAVLPRFTDLVLPERVESSLHRLVSWARRRDVVRAEGMLRGRGRGISALFTGNPGTGKTLAANVISAELGIELFQVDLSTIVDKYIGETEKNLERVFQAAESMDVVLFFDEADALFGARSGVQDARDRYANQEVSYLLQRMEQFDGITILSTNLRGNLDKAFSRRMNFIVHFPDPDVATRHRLWSHHLAQLPDQDPNDPVDTAGLAEAVQLAGGDIRNVVMAAALDAAGAGEVLGHRHVVQAATREHSKLGKVLPSHPALRVPRSDL